MKITCVLVLLSVLLSSLGMALYTSPPRLLSNDELAAALGAGLFKCDKAFGVMLAMASAAGATAAPAPPLSAGFLVGSLALGAAIVIWC